MKKILVLTCAFCFAYAAKASESPATFKAAATIIESMDWIKTPTGTWEGTRGAKRLFYKINATDGSLWSSRDNQKWEAVKEGAWQDQQGKWLKLENNELKSSTDGTTWSVVLDSQWEGANGTWYKFDKDLILWTKSGKL